MPSPHWVVLCMDKGYVRSPTSLRIPMLRGVTPQHRLHIAFPNASNPALPLNGRANRSQACFQQALFRLAAGFKPGAVLQTTIL